MFSKIKNYIRNPRKRLVLGCVLGGLSLGLIVSAFI